MYITISFRAALKLFFFQMRKKEECTKDAQTPRPAAGNASDPPKEKMGVHPPTNSAEPGSSGKKHARDQPPEEASTKKARTTASTEAAGSSTSSNKSLHKKIHHAVMHSVLPCVKLERATNKAPPSRTCFVVTESDALRKIARDILRKCPKLASSPNRKDLLVKLLELMQEEEDETGGASAQA